MGWGQAKEPASPCAPAFGFSRLFARNKTISASKIQGTLKARNSLISGSRPSWPYFPSDY